MEACVGQLAFVYDLMPSAGRKSVGDFCQTVLRDEILCTERELHIAREIGHNDVSFPVVAGISEELFLVMLCPHKEIAHRFEICNGETDRHGGKMVCGCHHSMQGSRAFEKRVVPFAPVL